jgi:hypothetical protein
MIYSRYTLMQSLHWEGTQANDGTLELHKASAYQCAVTAPIESRVISSRYCHACQLAQHGVSRQWLALDAMQYVSTNTHTGPGLAVRGMYVYVHLDHWCMNMICRPHHARVQAPPIARYGSCVVAETTKLICTTPVALFAGILTCPCWHLCT